MAKETQNTYSFIDAENQDFVRFDDNHHPQYGKIVKIKANSHGEANSKMFESDLCDLTDWTNTGVKTWCWEDME